MGDFLRDELLLFLVTVSMAMLWYQYRNESEKTGHAKVLKAMGVLKVYCCSHLCTDPYSDFERFRIRVWFFSGLDHIPIIVIKIELFF